jgi:hypothetical protein
MMRRQIGRTKRGESNALAVELALIASSVMSLGPPCLGSRSRTGDRYSPTASLPHAAVTSLG